MTTFGKSRSVFLSYARQDGEDFATALRVRLESEHPEIPLWQDRAKMEGGVGWWKQIEDAIDNSRFLVIVMTPGALESDITAKEWRYARQRGVNVYPIKGVPDAEIRWDSLPNWMKKAHWFDLRKEWNTFVEYLKSDREPVRVPFMAPDLMDDHVERPTEREAIIGRVFDSATQDPIAITTALYGAGGFGKTTLAAAVCHDDRVITAFDDGILWCTLGQSPDVQGELTRLFAALTGRSRPAFQDAADAADAVASKLADRNCLLVIDDVWNTAHVRPFLRGGKHCARIITTRVTSIAIDARAVPVEIDEMKRTEAVEILTKALPAYPPDITPYERLSRRLGEWPLLVSLAAGVLRTQLARGKNPRDALRFVAATLDRKGAVAFDRRDALDRMDAIRISVNMSLDLLDVQERERCVELAVFSEDTDIPLGAAQALWSTDDFETEQVLQRLDDASLIRFSTGRGTLRVHDVLRDYLQSLLQNPQEVHGRLIDGWGDPFELPDEYAWRHIAHHMKNGGRKKTLRALLLEFAWIDRKIEFTDVAALVRDFDSFREVGALRSIQHAIRLSSHVIAQRPEELAGQLFGRLGDSVIGSVKDLLRSTDKSQRNWLKPVNAVLVPPEGPQVMTLIGSDGVNLAIAQDESHVAYCSIDRKGQTEKVRVWDFVTGKELYSLEQERACKAVAITPDGSRTLTSTESSLEVCELATGRRQKIYTHGMLGLCFPDPYRAIAIGSHGLLQIWDLRTGKVQRIQMECGYLSSVAITPDAKWALAAPGSRVELWNLELPPKRRIIGEHSGSFVQVAITPDGTCGVSAVSSTLKVWDLVTGVERQILNGFPCSPFTLAISPDGSRVVSPRRIEIDVWNLLEGTRQNCLIGHTEPVRTVAISGDGRRAISAATDRTVKVWDLITTGSPHRPRPHPGSDGVAGIMMTADERRVVSWSKWAVKMWNVSTGEEQKTFELKISNVVRGIIVMPHGEKVVSWNAPDHALRLWDLETEEELRALTLESGKLEAFDIARNANRVVLASSDGTLRVWNLNTGEERKMLREATKNIYSLSVTPDGTRVVCCAYHRLEVWDLETGKARWACEMPGNPSRIAITPHGKRVVAAVAERLYILDLETGKASDALRGDGYQVTDVAVSGNGIHAVSSGGASALKLWNLETWQEKRSYHGHSDGVMAIALSRCGRWLASASRDKTVRLWSLASDTPIASYTGAATMQVCDISENGETVVAGDSAGEVHILKWIKNQPVTASD